MKVAGSQFHLAMAARVVRKGGVLAYPAEGVWGLGCNPFDPSPVARILAMKQRQVSKGLILLVANTDQLGAAASGLKSGDLDQLRDDPGYPVTWLIPDNGCVPDWISGGAKTVAVRISSHPLVSALCNRLNSAIVSTSANPGGRLAARDALRVRQYFNAEIDFLLPGQILHHQGASEIRDLRTGKVVRPRGQ